MVTHCRRQFDS